MRCLVGHEDSQGLRRHFLLMPDAHGLYRNSGSKCSETVRASGKFFARTSAGCLQDESYSEVNRPLSFFVVATAAAPQMAQMAILPFLRGADGRIYVASVCFWAGGMPPMPILTMNVDEVIPSG